MKGYTMKNVQISFDEILLEEVDRFASSNMVSRSEWLFR